MATCGGLTNESGRGDWALGGSLRRHPSFRFPRALFGPDWSTALESRLFEGCIRWSHWQPSFRSWQCSAITNTRVRALVLRTTSPIRWLAWLMMLAAIICLIAGCNSSPNPIIGATGQATCCRYPENDTPPELHRLRPLRPRTHANERMGGRSSIFGCFPTLGIMGGLHQDCRKLRNR